MESLVCPERSCKTPMIPNDIQVLTSEENYERYQRITLERALENMGGSIINCPRCNNKVPTQKEDSGEANFVCSFAMCNNCIYSFCSKCLKQWVQGPCSALKNLQSSEVKELIAAQKKGDQIPSDKATMLTEYLSLKAITTCSKRCPNCAILITKGGGCNKMTCHRCHTYFCWVCNRAITGYDHFQASYTGCKLFPETEEQELRDVTEGDIIEAEKGFDKNVFTLGTCPECDSVNIKVYDDIINCWSCGSPFCYVCGSYCFNRLHYANPDCPVAASDGKSKRKVEL